MTDDEKWMILQKEAELKAKEKLLEALLSSTGLGEYIDKAIQNHEQQKHDDD